MVGYGAVVLDGVFAVVALLAVTAGVASIEDWRSNYPGWPETTGLNLQLDLVITRMAGLVTTLGIPPAWAVGLVAAICAGLALTMLENVLRALGFAIGEFVEDFDIPTFGIAFFRERCAALITAAMVVWLSQHPLGMDVWLSLGITSRRTCGCFLLPFAIILPLTLGGTLWALLHWWERGAWQWFGLVTLTIVLGTVTMLVGSIALFKTYRERRASVPDYTASL